jgi:hypothetical protein
MTADEVIAQFQEWHLATALAHATRDVSRLWNNPVAQLVPRGEASRALSAILGSPGIPSLAAETPFLREDATRFGFEDEYYRANFWGLRPDFKMEASDVLVLLEAKGRSAPTKTWTDPKERLYYRFLAEAQVEKKGLFYAVPRSSETECSRCLSQHFQGHPEVRVGYILWEDLLPGLASDLLNVAVDEMVRATDGLRCLRQWQRERI